MNFYKERPVCLICFILYLLNKGLHLLFTPQQVITVAVSCFRWSDGETNSYRGLKHRRISFLNNKNKKKTTFPEL